MREQLKSSYIFKQKYGFLGELYYHKDKFKSVDKDILFKYFSMKNPYYCNRNMYYYNTHLEKLSSRLPTYEKDFDHCNRSIRNDDVRKDVLYSILSHEINDVSKLIGVVYSHKRLRDKYFDVLKGLIQEKCDVLVKIMFSDEIQDKSGDDFTMWNDLLHEVSSIEGLSIREYSEMDHPLLLVKSFFAYKDFIEDKHLFLGPLQGACMIPPFYISMLKEFSKNLNQINWDFNYVRHSNYDNTHYLDLSLDEQVNLLGNQYISNIPLLLIDDTTGTATTIKIIKRHLEKSFSNITTAVIECRWDTKLNNDDYPAFGMNDVDIITPLEYRHFRLFTEAIDYIKYSSNVNGQYISSSFYKEKFIYDRVDFYEYIDESEISLTNKKRLHKIIDTYKTISMTTYNSTLD